MLDSASTFGEKLQNRSQILGKKLQKYPQNLGEKLQKPLANTLYITMHQPVTTTTHKTPKNASILRQSVLCQENTLKLKN